MAVVISADGTPSRALRARLAGRRASLPRVGCPRARVRLRTRRPGSSAAPALLPSSTSTAPRHARVVDAALEESGGFLAAAAPHPDAARRLRHPARPGADRARRRRGRVGGSRARLSRSSSRRPRPGVHKTDLGGVALDLRDVAQVREAVERIGAPVIVQPFVTDGHRASCGSRAGPGLRPARRLRARRRLRRADRRGRLSDRAARRSRRPGARARREGGPPGRRLQRRSRPRTSAALVDLLLRLARLVEDIPEVAELDLNPILAQARRLRGGGCPHPDRRDPRRAAREELVTAPEPEASPVSDPLRASARAGAR